MQSKDSSSSGQQGQSCTPPRMQDGGGHGDGKEGGGSGVIPMGSICAVFNEPGRKGGCSVKLIGRSTTHTAHSTQHAAHSTQHTAHSTHIRLLQTSCLG
jgi:hypothetical protein